MVFGAVLTLAGCSRTDDAARTAAASSPATASHAVTTSQADTGRCDTPLGTPGASTLPRIAFIYDGPRDGPDAAPHERARTRLAQALTGRACLFAFDRLADGVDPQANVRYLLGTLALEGHALIVVTGPDHAETLARVAPRFPSTRFLHRHPQPGRANVRTYTLRDTEGAFLAGMVAASGSQGRPGILLRDRTPEEVALARAFEEGARAVNPSTSASVEVLGPSAGEAARAAALQRLSSRGAAVFFEPSSSPDLPRLAAGAGGHIVAWGDGPAGDASLATVCIDLEGFYRQEIDDVIRRASIRAHHASLGVAEGVIRLEDLSPLVPEPVRGQVTERARVFAASGRDATPAKTANATSPQQPVAKRHASEVERLVGYRRLDWPRLDDADVTDAAPVRLSGFAIPDAKDPKRLVLVPEFRDEHDTTPPRRFIHVQAREPLQLAPMAAISVDGRLMRQPRRTAFGPTPFTLLADSVEPYPVRQAGAGRR